MLRKLLIVGCLFGTLQLHAQKQQTPAADAKVNIPAPPKTETLTADQQIGAALPPFIVITMPKAETENKGKHKDTKQAPPKLIANKDVQYDANLFLMFFNPTCGHCEDMTVLLEHNIQLFHKTKVLMIASPVARPYVDMFEKGYNTDQYSTFMIGTDSLDLIGKLFLYKSLPQINVYDKDRKLLKSFSGDTPIDSLKPYIQ